MAYGGLHHDGQAAILRTWIISKIIRMSTVGQSEVLDLDPLMAVPRPAELLSLVLRLPHSLSEQLYLARTELTSTHDELSVAKGCKFRDGTFV